MVKKTIFSVGFDFPGNKAEYIEFSSDKSLLDADIILFSPDNFYDYNTDYTNPEYKGKRLLNSEDSFKLKENSSHWHRELSAAFDSGKTIFILLNKLKEVFVHTGEKTFSGNGKNARATINVDRHDNYDCIPFACKVISAKGNRIIPCADLKYLANYWKEFWEYSCYEAYFDGDLGQPLLKTAKGNKIVGAVLHGDKNKGEGNVFFIPKITYDDDDFTKLNEEDGKEYWSKEGIAFGAKLANCLVEIDKALKSDTEESIKPDWLNDSSFRLEQEATYEKNIADTTKKIEALELRRNEFELELKNETGIKRLLYEKGAQLEESIIECLKLLGFSAENYRDSNSEFDVLFKSSEGIFLGEAEGKDNKAIDVTKIRQLTNNLVEYHDKFDVFPKGILFGNAFRLEQPENRGNFFTEKCLESAKRFNIILIRTTDLFYISQYLKKSHDKDYKNSCRQIIFQTDYGFVEFPSIPESIMENRKERG